MTATAVAMFGPRPGRGPRISDAHDAGAPLRRLAELTAGTVTHPRDVRVRDAVPLGGQVRGDIPRT